MDTSEVFTSYEHPEIMSDHLVQKDKGRNLIFTILFFVVFQICYMVEFVNKVYFYDYRK